MLSEHLIATNVFKLLSAKTSIFLLITEEKEELFNHHKKPASISHFKKGNVEHLQMFSN